MTGSTFSFSFHELAVTLQDLLELAPEQSKGLDDFPDILEAVFSWAHQHVQATGGYRIYPLEICSSVGLSVEGLLFETGNIIARPFRKAESVAVFACTAGPGIQAACTDFLVHGETVKAYIMDTVGTVIVEKAMDRMAAALAREVAPLDWKISHRYSPGYCGWPVNEQQKLWSLLPVDFCGIHLNAASLMTPIKSISGFIGLGKEVSKLPYACSGCTMEPCLNRKRALRT